MAVGVVGVRRPPGDRDADQADDVRRRVGERVEAVGDDRHGPRVGAEDDLGDGDGEVEEEDLVEDAGDLVVAALARAGVGGQNTRAVGIGHHRSCTRPMMYFFGTMPQWRLSELLLRWSPITK